MYGVTLQDFQRAVALPTALPMTDEGAKAWTDYLCRPEAWSDPKFEGLRRTQAESIAYFHDLGGVVVSLRVSAGKALVAWACATLAINKHKKAKCLVVVPAKTLQNFWGREQEQARKWLKGVPQAHSYFGKSVHAREQLARKPGIHVVTQELLGTYHKGTGRELLRAINAHSYVIDEIHNFSRHSSARSKRVIGLIDELQLEGHDVCVAVLSASISTAGITRAYKPYQIALQSRSPLPTTAHNATRLEQEFDPSKGNPPLHRAPKPGEAVADIYVNWAIENVPGFPVNYGTRNRRYAYQLRQQYSPGVVMEIEKPDRTPTTVFNKPQGEIVERTEAFKKAWDGVISGITPSGDEISWEIEKSRYLSQLTAGFYVELFWPEPKVLAARRRISEDEAAYLIDAAKTERDYHNEYNKVLRETLSRLGDNPLDSPKKIGLYFEQSKGKPDRLHRLYGLWSKWKKFAREHDNLPERDSKEVLVDDYKLRAAVEWAKQGPGLLWVYHDPPFRWMQNYLRKAGVEPFVCDSGDKQAMGYLIGNPDPSRVYLIRIGGYGEGIELDFTHRAAYLEWRRNAKTMEQSLGRIDRSNQKAEMLEITTFISNWYDLADFSATIATAAKDRETSAASHLLLESTYDPPFEALTSSAQLATMFADYQAGDVDMQQVLRSLKST